MTCTVHQIDYLAVYIALIERVVADCERGTHALNLCSNRSETIACFSTFNLDIALHHMKTYVVFVVFFAHVKLNSRL